MYIFQMEIFRHKDIDLKISRRHLMSGEGQGYGEVAFSTPSKGTSMEDFTSMVQGFLQAKLGKGSHDALLRKILELADSNQDHKV